MISYNINIIYQNKEEMSSAKELQEKYNTSLSFQKEMKKTSQNYMLLSQQAHYYDLSVIQPFMISKFESERVAYDLYFFYAAYQPEEQKLSDKMLMFFITKIPKPQSKYSIIYVNDDINGGTKFAEFKNFFTALPIEYYVNLHKIYLVKPSLRIKASKYFSFHTISKYVNTRISEAFTIEYLCEKLKLQTDEVFKFLPEKVRMSFQEEQIELREKNQSEKKEKIIMKSVMPISQSVMPISQSVLPIKQTIQVKTLEIDQYEKSERGVPEILELLIFYFREHQDGLSQEGIFRKSVNIEEQTQIMGLLANKQYSCLQKVENPHIVANIIKRFFSKLATPVIPYEQFNKLMPPNPISIPIISETMKEIEQKNITKYLSLILLFEFLLKNVIPKAQTNKMTLENVSICFAPCFMWAKQASIKDIVYATKGVQVVMMMLSNFEQIFGNRKEQKKLFKNKYLMQKKKSLTEGFLLESSPEKRKSNQGDLLDHRKTPTFGQLMIQHTESYFQALAEEEDDTLDDNLSRKQSNPSYQISYKTEGPKIEERPQTFNPKIQIPQQSYKMHDAHKTHINLTGSHNLQIPKPARKGIFSSHLQMDRPGSNNSHRSNKSDQSNKSVHSNR